MKWCWFSVAVQVHAFDLAPQLEMVFWLWVIERLVLTRCLLWVADQDLVFERASQHLHLGVGIWLWVVDPELLVASCWLLVAGQGLVFGLACRRLEVVFWLWVIDHEIQ